MATYNTLLLRFTQDFAIGDQLKIFTVYQDAILLSELWNWVAVRSAANEVSSGIISGNAGESTAIQFEAAFDLDVLSGYVTTVQNVNEVLIASETEGEFFMGVQGAAGNAGQFEAEFDNGQGDPGGGTVSDVTVMIPRYYIDYCDDFNTDRQVLISERGYVGVAEALVGDVNPLLITYDSSSDFMFSPIRPSRAAVNVLFGTGDNIDFEDLWTADERQFLVQDIKDGQTEWSGYVIADGFSYDFHGGVYKGTLEASDGLGTLESIDFIGSNNLPYGNQDLTYNDEFLFPFSLICTEILGKLDLSLDLWTCVDAYEQSMTTTGDVREADPLSASQIDVRTFIKDSEGGDEPYWYGNGEVWNCKEVLESILTLFGAKVYQEDGVWRIKTINTDVDYGTGATQRYWRKYNTLGVYLSGYEVVDDQVNIPCNDSTKFLIENDHVMSMDEVYKAFRINYEYTFLRDGDSPINLIPNGDFCDFNNTSILAAPTGWARYNTNSGFLYSAPGYPRLRPITIPFEDAGGHTCGIELGRQAAGIPTSGAGIQTIGHAGRDSYLGTTDFMNVEQGAELSLSMWIKYRYKIGNNLYFPVFRVYLSGDDQVYFLRNIIVENRRTFRWEQVEQNVLDFEDITYLRQVFAHMYFFDATNADSASLEVYDWWNFDFDLGQTPVAGGITFEIFGLAAVSGFGSADRFPSYQLSEEYNDNWLRAVTSGWIDQGGSIPRMQLTGLKIGAIPNEGELPQFQQFIYENQNANYSLQVDPLTVYHGDLLDEYHISTIDVPSNVSGDKNFWTDLSQSYSLSSLGLLLARQIMRQYHKPKRILEGNVKIQDARFGTIYTFDVLSGLRWMLHRGSFNKQKQYIEDGMFIQVLDEALPDGGTESGNSLDADWQSTGVTYCEIGENGLNTGYVITQEQDVNPNSETYLDYREVLSASQDLQQCPLSTPRLYYWGSDDIYLNVLALGFAPYTVISPNEVQVAFNNDEGNYLYFVYLSTLGVVERITTPTSPNNVISDWTVLDNVIVLGYEYKVMRTDYVMTEFTNFIHNFKFA